MVLRKLTTARMYLGLLLVAIIGCVLLLLADKAGQDNMTIGSLAREVGALLVAAVGLAGLWEFFGKRSFAQEILKLGDLGEAIQDAGLQKLGSNYLDDVTWRSLMQGTKEADILVAYAGTWRNTHEAALKQMLSKRGATLRVYLPDSDNVDLMKEMARRMDYSCQAMVERVQDARLAFASLADGLDGTVEIFLRAQAPLYAAYRFDATMVVTVYKHRRQRDAGVPTFVFDEGGDMFEFFARDLEAVRQDSTRWIRNEPAAQPMSGPASETDQEKPAT